MREYFFREHRKVIRKSRRGDGNNYIPTWHLYDRLMFLGSNFVIDDENHSRDDDDDDRDVAPNGRGARDSLTNGDKRPPDKSDDLLFFESLLPYMANVSPTGKLRIKSKIQELVLNQIEALEKSNAQQNTYSPTVTYPYLCKTELNDNWTFIFVTVCMTVMLKYDLFTY